MIFLNPLWLLLLLLAPIIPILHSRNRRNVEVSSLFLWRRLIESTRPKAHRKIPPLNLLMVLQLLVLAAIALALARPERSGRVAGADHWIVLLDASAATQAGEPGGTTAFENARSHLRSALLEIDGRPARISLVRVTGRPAVLAARMRSPADVRIALDQARPTNEPADWARAASLLPGLLVGDESARVTVLSDPAGASEARRTLAAMSPELPLEHIAFAARGENLALGAVAVAPTGTSDGRWRVTGEIRASAEAGDDWRPRAIPLRAHFQPSNSESSPGVASWDVQIDRAGVVGFAVEVSMPDAGLLTLQLPEDIRPADNTASFSVFDEPRRARVLYVGSGNVPLEQALLAVPGVAISRANTLPADAGGYDLVVLDGVTSARHPGTNTLWLGTGPSATEAPALEDPAPGGWTTDHPLTRAVDWSVLEVTAARQLPRLPGAEVLLESSGAPLIQARTTGYGREVVVAFRPEDSNWPELLGFPAFFANLADWVVPDVGQPLASQCIVGEICRLGLEERTPGWRIEDPDGNPVVLPAASELGDSSSVETAIPRALEQLFRPERTGLYTLVAGGTRRQIPVNPSPAALPAGGAADALPAEPAPPAFRLPWWGWLLVVGLIALLVEAWIAGRKTERFLLLSGLSRENPLAPRRKVILALRGLALLLLVFALAKLPVPRPVRGANAVMVVDDLAGFGEEVQREAAEFLRSAEEEPGAVRRLAEIRAGDPSRVEQDLGGSVERPDSAQESRGLDLEGGMTLAGALLPPADPGRIVLLTDGAETHGDAVAALPRLLERGVPIDLYPISASRTGEVLIERLIAPQRVHEREAVELQGIVFCYCEAGVPASLRLLRNGVLTSQRSVELHDGRNRIQLPVTEDEPGRYLYELELVAQGDAVLENNRGGVALEVMSPPSVAIVTPQQNWGQMLADALSVQGVVAPVMSPAQAFSAEPGAVRPIAADLDLLILMNTPASDLSTGQQAELERWVREQGGGLLLLGGENTFGPGGYFDTPLETLSPLSAKVPQEIPKVAILFILDRSGSMLWAERGVTRLTVAKQATYEAFELLDPESLVGVIAFDHKAELVVPIQRAEERDAFREQLLQFQGMGGTAIYPALELGFQQLRAVDPSYARHLIVMTDGWSEPGEFDTLLPQIVTAGITVSAVAIGESADGELIERIALLGGGESYVDKDFQALPRILAQEAMRFTREAVKVETAQPAWLSREATFLQAMPQVPPPLEGFVETGVKPGADLHLVGPRNIPLLASWRYGLGRVVAFASHGAGTWAANWMADPAYPLWWSQMARWALSGTSGSGLHLELQRDGDDTRILVEAVADNGVPRRGLDVVATVIAPDSTRVDGLHLREVEPGVYEGSFVADRAGEYRVAVSTEAVSREAAASAEQLLYVAYPARYEFSRSDPQLPYFLAELSGGRVMRPGDPIFLGAAPLRWAWGSGWKLWSLLALTLFFADLLLRYLPARRSASRR